MRQFDIPVDGLPPVDHSAASNWNPDEKVIIIGAGAAGITAAYTLKHLNVPFILLEASNRHGGRVQRNEDFLGNGVALDTGAEWIHTTRDVSVLKELLLVESDRMAMDSFIKEEIIEYDLPEGIFYYYNCLGRLSKNHITRCIYDHEYKFKTKSWSQYLETYLFSYIKDSIEYEAIVKEIDYSSPDSVKVTLANFKQYSAAKVICTVPVSILKRGDIKFTPELPKAKQNALNKNKMKPGFKMMIEFKKQFYPDAFADVSALTSFFWLISDLGSERVYFDALAKKDLPDKHVLGVYCYGVCAEDLSKLTDEDMFKDIMEKLDVIFDGEASANYIKHKVYNWTKEPFIYGVASNMLYAGLMRKEFGKAPLNDRVFFGGEFTGGKYVITVHGACLTGRRAALNAVGEEYDFD
mmetsp:Transcript_7187/g.10961  ORF Transcript_7187/g.10961 Transcript_7187/m.10961 type:complete len:409 (+) Transcript_7187:255-1481(+)